MAEERVQRRLAAILAADVVGYSRLIERDEAGTLAALKHRRKDVLAPLVAEHHGRIVKVMGDGVLVEFASAVNAVACAVELQKRMATANDGIADERRIVLRIGINLGDVVVEGGDLYGDGVIIAVRLQAMAEPGGTCISGKVHDEVQRKLPLTFVDMGDQAIKNIETPIRVHRIAGQSQTAVLAGDHPLTATKPSIAVLPFTNMSGDPEERYFSDGVTENIITELSRFHQLLVIARNSSFQYRNTAIDVKRVARELGVKFVVEGSVSRAAHRVRITARLVDASTGIQLWADRYDRDLKDVFDVQDEVIQTIVAILPGRIEEAGVQSARRKRPENLAAYDFFLRGMECHLTYDRADNRMARQMFEKAIALEPDLAAAYAWLATQHMRDWFRYQSAEASDRAFILAQKGATLDPGDSVCEMMLGFVCLYRSQLDDAVVHITRAIALNPNDPNNAVTMALLQAYLGCRDEAIEWMNKAFLLNPYPPPWYFPQHGIVLYVAHRYAEAVAAFRRVVTSLDPGEFAYLVASMGQLGRSEEARATLAQFQVLYPEISMARVAALEPFRNPNDLEHLNVGLRKAGLPE